MPSSFTHPAKTSMDISVTPSKSKSYYIQYLLSGQVPTAVYGRPIGLCCMELTTLLVMISQQRYCITA